MVSVLLWQSNIMSVIVAVNVLLRQRHAIVTACMLLWQMVYYWDSGDISVIVTLGGVIATMYASMWQFTCYCDSACVVLTVCTLLCQYTWYWNSVYVIVTVWMLLWQCTCYCDNMHVIATVLILLWQCVYFLWQYSGHCDSTARRGWWSNNHTTLPWHWEQGRPYRPLVNGTSPNNTWRGSDICLFLIWGVQLFGLVQTAQTLQPLRCDVDCAIRPGYTTKSKPAIPMLGLPNLGHV